MTRTLLKALLCLSIVALLPACKNSDTDTYDEASEWPSELAVPIRGATFSLAASHLPGAPRNYRNGSHKGFDFFNGLSGRPLSEDEPVVAVADGEIVRIDHAYEDSSADSLSYWAQLASEDGMLGRFAFDQLHGRQVWIRHSDGHISRYSHLSTMDPELHVGDRVEQNQPIALMGNSGIPPTEDQPDPAPHLHFELWSPDGQSFLGQDASPLDIHRTVSKIFGMDALPRYARQIIESVEAGEPAPETYPPKKLPEVGFSMSPPKVAAPGQPFAVAITWENDDFVAADFSALLAGLPLGIVDAGNGVWIVGAMPLGWQQDSAHLLVNTTDPFGQSLVGGAVISRAEAEPPPSPLEVDTVTFQVHSEENHQQEAQYLIPVSHESLRRTEPLWENPFDAPVDGDIVQHFGQRIVAGMLRPNHPSPGIVATTEPGTRVLASNDGIVGLVEDLPIRGRTVAIIHGSGVISVYGHLEDALVSPGDRVSQGQPIGTAGTSGAAFAPSLRWEMLVGNVPTNPVSWLDQLLPGETRQ